MKFIKAEKKRFKLRLGLIGPSGSGKTYSSLLIAAGMGGRVAVIEIGIKSEQREGAKYEFTTILDHSQENYFAIQSKDRTGLFVNRDPFVIGTETGKALMDWLNSGADPVETTTTDGVPFNTAEQCWPFDRQKVKDWCASSFGLPWKDIR